MVEKNVSSLEIVDSSVIVLITKKKKEKKSMFLPIMLIANAHQQ